MSVKMINVKLSAKLVKRGAGLVDPKTGLAISAAKTAGPEGQAVPYSNFIAARLHSGELIQVQPASEPAGKLDDTPVKVTFKINVEKGEIDGKKYKAGDETTLPGLLATKLRAEGKIV